MGLSMGEVEPEALQLRRHPRVEYTPDVSTYMSSWRFQRYPYRTIELDLPYTNFSGTECVRQYWPAKAARVAGKDASWNAWRGLSNR